MEVDKEGFLWHIKSALGLEDFSVIFGNMYFLVNLYFMENLINESGVFDRGLSFGQYFQTLKDKIVDDA